MRLSEHAFALFLARQLRNFGHGQHPVIYAGFINQPVDPPLFHHFKTITGN
jgi:hypothetical protein